MFSKIRLKAFFLLLIITPLGFLFKFYSGPVAWWFNNYGAGLLYEIFWILVVFFFLPRKIFVLKIVIWVFVVTSFLEILQLWHPWILEQIRSTFIGRTLIGTSFVWWDFPHYVVGCFIGLYLANRISKSDE